MAYAEILAAQHAFDMFHTVRSTPVVNGVVRRRSWLRSRQ